MLGVGHGVAEEAGGGRQGERTECLCCVQGREKGVVEERESEARLLVCCSFSLSLPPCSRWLLCFGLVSPLAFLDLVAQIQGGGRGKRARQRANAKLRVRGEVRLKLKEQGAQMAVGSSGVDCGVWTKQFVGRPEGNSGTE